MADNHDEDRPRRRNWPCCLILALPLLLPIAVILSIWQPWSNHPRPSALGRPAPGWILPGGQDRMGISLGRMEVVKGEQDWPDWPEGFTDHGDGTIYDWDDEGAWFLKPDTPLEEAVRVEDTTRADVYAPDGAYDVFIAHTCAEGQRRAGLIEWRNHRITVHGEGGDRMVVTPCIIERAVLSPDREWVAFLYAVSGIASGKAMYSLGVANLRTGEVGRLTPFEAEGRRVWHVGSHPPLQWVEHIPEAFIIHREPLSLPAD